jgi:hypothetical protein
MGRKHSKPKATKNNMESVYEYPRCRNRSQVFSRKRKRDVVMVVDDADTTMRTSITPIRIGWSHYYIILFHFVLAMTNQTNGFNIVHPPLTKANMLTGTNRRMCVRLHAMLNTNSSKNSINRKTWPDQPYLPMSSTTQQSSTSTMSSSSSSSSSQHRFQPTTTLSTTTSMTRQQQPNQQRPLSSSRSTPRSLPPKRQPQSSSSIFTRRSSSRKLRQKMKPMPILGYNARNILAYYDARPLEVGWRLNSLGFPLLGTSKIISAETLVGSLSY